MKSIFLSLISLISLYGCGICGNEILQSEISPSGELQAIVFNRNCGVTTGFNTQISILPVGGNLTNDSGNTFIIDNEISLSINWIV